MAAHRQLTGLELGIPQEIKDAALAYLVVVLENAHADRLEEDIERPRRSCSPSSARSTCTCCPPTAAAELIDAREKAFWIAKANGADDIIDVVVPRARSRRSWTRCRRSPTRVRRLVAGCGHAGDGNVHLAVFQPDDRSAAHGSCTEIFAAGMDLGGAISAEHGIGKAKKQYFLDARGPDQARR